jgi:hypothetical protein
MTRVQFPSRAMMGLFLFVNMSQPSLGTHSASYPVDTGGCYSGGRATGPWSWPFTPSSVEVIRIRGFIHPLPQYVFVAWCLVKKRYKFNFTCRDKFPTRSWLTFHQWNGVYNKSWWENLILFVSAKYKANLRNAKLELCPLSLKMFII